MVGHNLDTFVGVNSIGSIVFITAIDYGVFAPMVGTRHFPPIKENSKKEQTLCLFSIQQPLT